MGQLIRNNNICVFALTGDAWLRGTSPPAGLLNVTSTQINSKWASFHSDRKSTRTFIVPQLDLLLALTCDLLVFVKQWWELRAEVSVGDGHPGAISGDRGLRSSINSTGQPKGAWEASLFRSDGVIHLCYECSKHTCPGSWATDTNGCHDSCIKRQSCVFYWD